MTIADKAMVYLNKNMKTSLYFLVIIMVFASCTARQKQDSLKKSSTNPKELKCSILHCDSTVWSPLIVCSINNKIVNRLYAFENIFHLYQLNINNTIDKIGEFGRKGNGPKEFQSIGECLYDEEKNILFMFSKNDNAIKVYKADMAFDKNLLSSNTWEVIDLSCDELRECRWGNILPISDSLYIGLGGNYNKNSMISEINLTTNKVNEINIPYPNDNIEVSTLIKQSIYLHGELLKRPTQNQYLYYCSNWGNYAEIITLDDNNMLLQRNVLANNFPIYSVGQDGINPESSKNTLMGIKAYVTKNFVYLLPNFLTKDEYLHKNKKDGYPSDYCDILYKFNWEAEFIESYKLEKPILNFVVDPEDRYIIGGSILLENGEYIFAKYLLI